MDSQSPQDTGNMRQVMLFFGPWRNTTEFSREWKLLTDQDKADLKTGIANGSLTY